MKLVRYGPAGGEKPGLIDDHGQIRDLSGEIADIAGENLAPAALDRLKSLEFDTMVPGHGLPFQERAQIDHLQAYLRDLNRQVTALHAQGVSPRDAVEHVDLSSHAEHYGQGVSRVDPRAVLRMYELLQVRMPR